MIIIEVERMPRIKDAMQVSNVGKRADCASRIVYDFGDGATEIKKEPVNENKPLFSFNLTKKG